MKQTTALAILDAGKSVFLTGPAGSGKTYVLQTFIKNARRSGKNVAVTASTGLAATHLGGSTIHSWSGIGIADQLTKRHIQDLSQTRKDQILDADILIIDEVSMLHDYRLDMIDAVCREVRGDNQPFGGLQIILSGDFYQLPPVNRADSRQGGFATDAEVWETLDPVICYLQEQHRQADDMLLEILTALRRNDVRRRHAEALLARKRARTPFDDPVTELYTTNMDVDKINQARLHEMDGDAHSFNMTHTGSRGAVEALQRSCMAPAELVLKVGAFVMFVKNSPEKKYVNGTLGTVIEFETDTGYPVVETLQGKRVVAEPVLWEMRDGEKKVAGLTQVPLRLAWAITVHKSQGMTLDAAHIDLSKAFTPGMGYVALSRVRSLETLTLGGLNRTALIMHDHAHQLDEYLREVSKSHTAEHAHLEQPYLDKIESMKKEPPKDWSTKLEKMRSKHPNAYKPWKKLEDTALLTAWSEGKTVKQLAKQLGRHDGSIRARLKKHLGEELFQKK